MSLSAQPEWKQLLLERKRRDEEERERREREEEERLASMPAWKREIIQRRKAKQDEEREKEREKDEGQPTPDVSAIIEEVIITEQTDSKLNPNQLSKETVSSIRQNPFIRSENSWRRDSRKHTNNNTGRGWTVETEKEASRGKEREFWKDRDMRIERTESKSEDRSTEKKRREVDHSTSLFPPVTGLHTIKANNIIIIEKEKNNTERLERRESGREEVHREEKRMRMDLREFLAGGGSVTEIRATEVLIIKPPVTDEKVEVEIPGVQERVSSRERLERERIWRREREMERDQRAETNHKNEECGGRVSQLLSKFGELPKPPVRSKSTDCFHQSGKNRARYSTGDLHVQEDEDTRPTFRGVPKRSFSFSDRVLCRQENGECEEELEFKVVERTYSDRRVKPSAVVPGTDQSESEARVTRRWGRQKRDDEDVMLEKRQKERNQTVCKETHREEGFTVATVKNPEGIAFARRVQIKQERRENSSERENRTAREERIETDKKRETLEGQKQTESRRTWNQEVNVVTALIQPHNDCTDHNNQFTTPSEDDSLQSSALSAQPNSLSQQTERVQELNKPFSSGDPDMSPDETPHTTVPMTYPKQTTDKSHFTSHISQQPAACTQEEVTIPTTVFYGVDVSAVRKASLPLGDGQSGAGVERRGSWKAGRPLTRVESLRERILQQEEMQRGGKTEAEGTVREVTAKQQDETTLQTLRLFDVTQEVTLAKSSPQLPVPVSLSHLQSALSEREVGEISGDERESDLYRRETKSAQHVEECESCSIWRRQDFDVKDDEIERELLEEEYLPPSLSPSPPLSDALDEMSRIYNLKAVGSRSAVCISERKGDISTHNRGQYIPIRSAQSPDILPDTAKLWNCGTARDVDKTETVESTGVQTVQRQVERLQLKEQEEGCEALLTEQEAKTAEGQKRPDILKETQKSQTPTNTRFPQVQQKAQRSHAKPQQLKSFTVNARNAQPTENTSRSPEQGNCPSSSSPSTTPSPPLFNIRSASSGPGKRGTTITITPRRSGAVTPSAGTSTGPSGPPSRAVPQGQTPNRDANKKRYPTAEEIEVIGGYQNLERSCLMKSRGTSKAVCERVCVISPVVYCNVFHL